MNKTKLIYELVKTLEPLENTLCFTVFYSFAEFQKSHHYCPAFEFEGYYYEIQYNGANEVRLLGWTPYATDVSGYDLSENEIEELISALKEVEIKDPLEGEGWQHFLKGNIITSEFSQDVIYSIRTEKLTREEIMERYNIKL